MSYINTSHTILIKADIIENAARAWPEAMKVEMILRGTTNVSATDVFRIDMVRMPGAGDNLEVNIVLRDRHGEPYLAVGTGQYHCVKHALLALKQTCRSLGQPARLRPMRQVTKSGDAPMALPRPSQSKSSRDGQSSSHPPMPAIPDEYSSYQELFQDIERRREQDSEALRARHTSRLPVPSLPTMSSMPNMHSHNHNHSNDMSRRRPLRQDDVIDERPEPQQEPPTAALKRSRARRQPSDQHPYRSSLQQGASLGNLHEAKRSSTSFERFQTPMHSKSQEDFTAIPQVTEQPPSEQEHREVLMEEWRNLPRPTALLPPGPFAPRGGKKKELQMKKPIEEDPQEKKRYGVYGNVSPPEEVANRPLEALMEGSSDEIAGIQAGFKDEGTTE